MEMNEEYIDNVKQLIELKDADKVKELLVDLHPADIAELLSLIHILCPRYRYAIFAIIKKQAISL